MDQNTQVPVPPPPAPPAALAGPLSLLGSAWAFMTRHWKLAISIVVIPSLIMVLGNLLIVAGGLALLGAAVEIVGVVFSVAMQAALMNTVHRLSTEPGATLSLGSQYRFGFSCFWSLVFLGILMMFVALGSTVLFIIPGIVIVVYSSFYLYARVIDGHRGFAALVESFRLVRGRWWAVFGRFLFLIVVYLVAALIFGGLAYLIDVICGATSQSGTGQIVSLIVNLGISICIGPLVVAYLYNLYVSLKATSAPQPVSGTFKGWLIAFLVVGILAILALPVLGLTFLGVYQGLENARALHGPGEYYQDYQGAIPGGPSGAMPILGATPSSQPSGVPQNY